MSALDTIADKAQAASRRFAGQGGLKGKLSDELADDAAFIRKLKPSLIKARATGRQPGSAPPAPSQPAPSEPAISQPAPSQPTGRNTPTAACFRARKLMI